MLANVQTCFEERKYTAWQATCKLDGDGSVSYVAPKQKDSKGCGIGNRSSKIDQAWCDHTI